MESGKPRLALTIGDPAGIGPEIVVKSLADREVRACCRPLVVGDAALLRHVAKACGVGLDAEIVDLGNARGIAYGEVDARAGAAAVQYVEEACRLVRDGEVDGLVTAPINKAAIRAAGSDFPGHTEMLAALLGRENDEVFTMFVLGRLRIFFLTRHYPLAEAIGRITTERVVDALTRISALLGMLGTETPQIALAALNPHAGENGLLGREEGEILEPAVAAARSGGVDVVGPVPADAVFHQCLRGRYDAVLCLYHDQGHIAAKTVDFFGTVSCTLGLPVIRTSVDHGTAFDIAGRWIADAGGQVAATRVAAELAPRVLAATRTARGS